jgi:hypothetical protein
VKPISRVTDLGVEIYDAEAQLVATVAVPDSIEGHAVDGSLATIAYVTDEDVVCVDRWQFPLGTRSGDGRNDCAFSADDALLWVYVPDDGGPDRWIALDAETGEPRVVHELACSGQGGTQFPTPDGKSMLLDVGEGTDGSLIFRAGLGDELHRYPARDRVLVGLSPGGDQLMSVHHEQRDVAFHTVPDGEIRIRVPVAGFGYRPKDAASVEWTGGFLDDDTAVVVLAGENGDGPWWRHHTVDVRTGEVTGTLPVTTVDEYDLQPLGDGSFLVTDTDGTLRRLFG